jgi:Rieske Fe-S protein
MTDVVSERMAGDGSERQSVVDVDVHEMLTSIKDLVPYLDEPWQSRVAVNDGFKGPPGNPYAFPQAAGVATADAVTDDGNVLLCPWHGFEFDLDLETGGDPCVPGRPDLKLKTYRVEVEDGKVVVYLLRCDTQRPQ